MDEKTGVWVTGYGWVRRRAMRVGWDLDRHG